MTRLKFDGLIKIFFIYISIHIHGNTVWDKAFQGSHVIQEFFKVGGWFVDSIYEMYLCFLYFWTLLLFYLYNTIVVLSLYLQNSGTFYNILKWQNNLSAPCIFVKWPFIFSVNKILKCIIFFVLHEAIDSKRCT